MGAWAEQLDWAGLAASGAESAPASSTVASRLGSPGPDMGCGGHKGAAGGSEASGL